MNSSDPPLVSVIVPTCNRAAILAETLRSILGQTFRDFELIVVSDGSTDETASIVEKLADPRVVFIEQGPSGRPSVPRNRGLRQARGAFIALCDDDDLWRPEKLARQVEFLHGDASIGLCYTNTIALRNGVERHARLRAGECVRNLPDLIWHNYIATSTVLVRKEVFEVVGGFDEEPRLCPFDDYEMWLRIAYRYPIAYMDELLVAYRIHEKNIVARFADRELIAVRVLRTAMQKIPGHRPAFCLSMGARLGKYLVSALRGHAYRTR